MSVRMASWQIRNFSDINTILIPLDNDNKLLLLHINVTAPSIQ